MSAKDKFTDSASPSEKKFARYRYNEDRKMEVKEVEEKKEEARVTIAGDGSNEDQDELLNLLTLDYIDRVEKGENPNLAEYVKRYPHLEEGLKANITYYLQEAKGLFDEFTQEETSAVYQAELLAFINDPGEQERMRQLVAEFANQSPPNSQTQDEEETSQVKPVEPAITDLYQTAKAKGFNSRQLAREVGISSDLMLALQRRTVQVVGLPRKLALRISEALGISVFQLLNYLNRPALPSANYFNTDQPEVISQQDFATYVSQSEGLDSQQKEFWLKEIETDAFTSDDLG